MKALVLTVLALLSIHCPTDCAPAYFTGTEYIVERSGICEVYEQDDEQPEGFYLVEMETNGTESTLDDYVISAQIAW